MDLRLTSKARRTELTRDFDERIFILFDTFHAVIERWSLSTEVGRMVP